MRRLPLRCRAGSRITATSWKPATRAIASCSVALRQKNGLRPRNGPARKATRTPPQIPPNKGVSSGQNQDLALQDQIPSKTVSRRALSEPAPTLLTIQSAL